MNLGSSLRWWKTSVRNTVIAVKIRACRPPLLICAAKSRNSVPRASPFHRRCSAPNATHANGAINMMKMEKLDE
jgi:hypothetical protein